MTSARAISRFMIDTIYKEINRVNLEADRYMDLVSQREYDSSKPSIGYIPKNSRRNLLQ